MHISYTKQGGKCSQICCAESKGDEASLHRYGTSASRTGEEFSGVAGQVLAQNGVETEKIMRHG